MGIDLTLYVLERNNNFYVSCAIKMHGCKELWDIIKQIPKRPRDEWSSNLTSFGEIVPMVDMYYQPLQSVEANRLSRAIINYYFKKESIDCLNYGIGKMLNELNEIWYCILFWH